MPHKFRPYTSHMISSSGGWIGARITAAYVVGGIAVGLALALPISEIPEPGHPHVARNVAAGLVLLASVTAASWGWGRALAIATGCPDPRRIGRVGALVFAPTMFAASVVLGLLEPVFVARGAEQGLPIHVVYTLLFVPSTMLVAGATAFAIGWTIGDRREAVRMAATTGGVAALAFLAIDLAMDANGWRVGGPDAATRATMLVVTLLGCLGAALAGGAVLGRGMVRVNAANPSRPRTVGTDSAP